MHQYRWFVCPWVQGLMVLFVVFYENEVFLLYNFVKALVVDILDSRFSPKTQLMLLKNWNSFPFLSKHIPESVVEYFFFDVWKLTFWEKKKSTSPLLLTSVWISFFFFLFLFPLLCLSLFFSIFSVNSFLFFPSHFSLPFSSCIGISGKLSCSLAGEGWPSERGNIPTMQVTSYIEQYSKKSHYTSSLIHVKISDFQKKISNQNYTTTRCPI